MNTKEYFELQKKRKQLKLMFPEALWGDAESILNEYDRKLQRQISSLSETEMTGSSFKGIVGDFVVDLQGRINQNADDFVKRFSDLYGSVQNSIDIPYPIEPTTLPLPQVDDFQIIREVEEVLNKYRSGDITEDRMRKLMRGRLSKPAFMANTIANTNLAGWDNENSRQIAELGQLNYAYYEGPPAQPDLSHDLCLKLAGKNLLYSVEAIQAMTNGTSLRVLIYCGGYNCLHEWVWVNPEWSRMKGYQIVA